MPDVSMAASRHRGGRAPACRARGGTRRATWMLLAGLERETCRTVVFPTAFPALGDGPCLSARTAAHVDNAAAECLGPRGNGIAARTPQKAIGFAATRGLCHGPLRCTPANLDTISRAAVGTVFATGCGTAMEVS